MSRGHAVGGSALATCSLPSSRNGFSFLTRINSINKSIFLAFVIEEIGGTVIDAVIV